MTITVYEAVWEKKETDIPANTSGCLHLTYDKMTDLIKEIECLIKAGEKAKGTIVVNGTQGEPPKK